ncbi:MAG: thiol:disulfide interchange protein [Gammaproteobacteria bacterium]|nr:MAG: thiol:disulfide interchange protein [Gammaproteobacteria bacterium]
MKKILLTLILLVSADVFAGQSVDLTLLKDRLGSQAKIKSVKPSIIDGLYEVQINGQIIYLSNDGEKVISGSVYDLKNKISHTEMASNRLRKEALAEIADADKIIYQAKDEKYKVTVFTDISCPYCTKLHKQVPAFNDLGITVEYLAFPRAGIGSETEKKMQRVWCAENKTLALTEAKENNKFPKKSCDGKQVAQQFLLGDELGINATPTMVLSDGELQSGYMTPDDLLTYLQSKEK